MSQRNLTSNEVRFLQEALNANHIDVGIRLREGEYQFELAKVIAAFHQELYFPDVKDIIRRLYGEDKAGDVQFVRKIQTILKKMEKSHIVRILPKKEPWELQRYALSSFKFQDSDKNLVILVSDEQVRETQGLLRSMPIQQNNIMRSGGFRVGIFVLALIVISSYTTIVWSIMQPAINPIVVIAAFSIAVVFSLILGEKL